jgi:hypothetical protein
MPDSLFYLVLVMVAGILIFRAVERRRARLRAFPDLARGARYGPVPGYAYLPGGLVRWDPDRPPRGLGKTWQPKSLETIHAGRRTRLVLTLEVYEMAPAERVGLMKDLARRLQDRTGFRVVAVRLAARGSQQADQGELVFSPDGGGWTGTASDATVSVKLPEREPFRLQAPSRSS